MLDTQDGRTDEVTRDIAKRPWTKGPIPRLGLAILLVLLIAGGSGLYSTNRQEPEISGTGASGRDDEGQGSAAASGSISGLSRGSQSGTGSAAESGRAGKVPPKLGLPEDYAFGSYDNYGQDQPIPRGCELRRGQPCVLLFHANYRVFTKSKAVVRFAAYENGRSEPVAHLDVPVSKGTSRLFHDLAYTPSADAETVQFKVQLLDESGTLIHEVDPPPPVLPIQP